MSKKISLSLFVIFFISLSSAFSQVEVIVGSHPKIAVEVISGDSKKVIQKTIKNDLRLSSLFDIRQSNEADYYIRGSFSGGKLKGILVEKKNQLKPFFEKTYQGNTPRILAHRFANDVLKKTSDVEGFFLSKIAFISKKTGKKELYMSGIDGKNPKQLTKDGSIANAPSWGPQGKKIAYTSYHRGYPYLYAINLHSKTRSLISSYPGINSGAAFSPSGKRIALTLSKDGNPEIYIIPASGGRAKAITRSHGTCSSPSWSPKGKYIVYTSDGRGTPQLFIVRNNGSKASRLLTGQSYNTEPSWSPDGRKIALTTRLGGQFQIALYDIKKRRSDILTTNGGEDPSWTSNSRHLVFSNEGRLYVLDSVTKNIELIKTPFKQCSEPNVSP